MDDRGVHRIDEYLSEDWIDAWARDGLRRIEDYLAKHAAFEAFLDGGD